jgi:hypothetical protein
MFSRQSPQHVFWLHADEVARPRLGREFRVPAPPHPLAALDDVDHAFQVIAMVVGRWCVVMPWRA